MAADSVLPEPITALDDLERIFHEAERPEGPFLCGAEMEKFGVLPDGSAMQYEGPNGVAALLEHLAEAHGWTTVREVPGGPLIALEKGAASITLEPGSQLELSGAALGTAHEICAELRAHMGELEAFSKAQGIRWLGLGFHPFASRSDYAFVPKQRYAIMREYLPTRGALALDMMLRTATVQANFDYRSEEDAMRKLAVGLKLAPLTTAMFANSPVVEGRLFGGKSYRAKVWLETDPDRSGLVPQVWREGARYRDYVEWALDVPMFLIKRDGIPVLNTGQTFRAFLSDGFQGHRATVGDWHMHLQTLFPEVRLKRTLEVRGADSQGTAMACALPSLYLGLYYDDRAFAEAWELTRDFTFEEVSATRREVWRSALSTPFRGGTLRSLAERVLDIAEGGLARRAKLSRSGKDERVHLARLRELVARGESPADALVGGLTGDSDGFRDELLRRAELPMS